LAGAKQLAIFHHDPDHVDADMAEIERQARSMWGGAMVSRDDMTVCFD
jgi:phosphoribosyl 1,2-cyclic phosphodiesterase